MASVFLFMFVPLANSLLPKPVALQGLQNCSGGAVGRDGVHGNLRLLGGAVLPVLVAVPVLVFQHPAVGHLGGDAGIRAHGQERSPARGEESFLAQEFMLLLVVFGGVEKQVACMHVGRWGQGGSERRRGWRRVKSWRVPSIIT